MENALELDIHGIRCDNPNCDYEDMTVQMEDYEQWLNKPCPKCGQNLLTEEDYRNTLFLIEMTKVANKIYNPIKDDEEIVNMRINMDGSGDIKFNIEKGN